MTSKWILPTYLMCDLTNLMLKCHFWLKSFFFSLWNSVDGQKYFTCQPKYGSMVPIMAIEVGDFPPEEDGLDDDEI